MNRIKHFIVRMFVAILTSKAPAVWNGKTEA